MAASSQTPRAKTVGLLFGLNYSATPESRLNGCINDVVDMGAYLRECGVQEVKTYTDAAGPRDTSRASIIAKLTELSRRSWSDDLDMAWIHYSGHGSFIADRSRDEDDGRDECIVPSDYLTAGMIIDDVLRSVLASFNPRTWLIMVTDACHSATMGDMKFLWNVMGPNQVSASVKSRLECKPRVIMISGCRDDQTSADAYNAAIRKYQGAMTAALLDCLRQSPNLKSDVVALVWEVKNLLRRRRFSQVPQLTTSVDFNAAGVSRSLFPLPPRPPVLLPMWKRVVSVATASAGVRRTP